MSEIKGDKDRLMCDIHNHGSGRANAQVPLVAITFEPKCLCLSKKQFDNVGTFLDEADFGLTKVSTVQAPSVPSSSRNYQQTNCD